MFMTRSRNRSRNPSSGASPVLSSDGERSPSPPSLRTSRVRIQMPSAAKKSAAKSDCLPVVGL